MARGIDRPQKQTARQSVGITWSGPSLRGWQLKESAMASEPLNPGDEAAPGTPGTGENICRECGGSGERDGGECSNCAGTGKVIEGIGGA